MSPEAQVPDSEYFLAQPLLVRLMGTLLVGLGLLIFLVSGLVLLLDLHTIVLTVVVVSAVGSVLVIGFRLSRHSAVLHFDADGYRVRWVRGAGVKQGRWVDVEDAVTAVVGGVNCILLRRRDGRSTTLPISVLDAGPDQVVQDLRARLDAGRGYRRL